MKTETPPLDEEQKAAAHHLTNVVVSAGAGSGKTKVLSDRFLFLLEKEKVQSGQILCVTFTKKAAIEMQDRIYKKLIASKEATIQNIVAEFADSYISTIDSFLYILVGQAAIDYGYPNEVTIDDEACKSVAEALCMKYMMQHRENPILLQLVAANDFDTVCNQLLASLVHEITLPSANLSEIKKNYKKQWLQVYCSRSCSIILQLPVLENLCRKMTKDSPVKVLEQCKTKEIQKAIDVAKSQQQSAQSSDWKEESAKLLSYELKKLEPLNSINLRSWPRTDEAEEAKKILSSLKSSVDNLKGCIDRYDVDCKIFDIICKLGIEYNKAKKDAGIMSFRDVMYTVKDALEKRKDIRNFWKYKFKYIMVDEFQDTNQIQKDLLYLLAEKDTFFSNTIPDPKTLCSNKLFFVGDAMQSIYRFRGADVSVFNNLAKDLSQSLPSTNSKSLLNLSTNYRSEPALVNFFNVLFARVFADAEKDYEAVYSPIKSRSSLSGIKPLIQLFYKHKQSNKGDQNIMDSDTALAVSIANFINDSCGELSISAGNEGGKRLADYGDFAILLRTRAKQSILEQALRHKNVPYTVDSSQGIFKESVANDIYACLQLLLFRNDVFAYATVLRSPLVGISNEGLILLLCQQKNSSSWKAFDPNNSRILDDKDKEKYNLAVQLYKELDSMREKSSICDMLHVLWFEKGLRFSILVHPDAHQYLEHFDFIFNLAARYDSNSDSLYNFVQRQRLKEQDDRGEDSHNPNQRVEGSVRILTIHGAKGLEFPVVILPWLETSGQTEKEGLWHFINMGNEEKFLCLGYKHLDFANGEKKNFLFDKDKESNEILAENKRLFYVACTRAMNHLVFAAIEPARKTKNFLQYLLEDTSQAILHKELTSHIQLELIPELSKEEYGNTSSKTAKIATKLLSSYNTCKIINRSRDRSQLTVSDLQQIYLYDNQQAKKYNQKEEVQSDANYAMNFGILCHHLIQCKIEGKKVDDTKIKELQLPNSNSLYSKKEAEKLALGFIQSDFYKNNIAKKRNASEHDFFLYLDSQFIISGRIDLVCWSDEEIIVVDFKSNLTKNKEDFSLQLYLYRKAAQAIFSTATKEKQISSYLFWLQDSVPQKVDTMFDDSVVLEIAKKAACTTLSCPAIAPVP